MSEADEIAEYAVAGYEGAERRAVEGIVERRAHRRYAVDAWAEVMVKDGTMLFRGRVLDISVAGCYVATEARLRLAPGTAVEMIFRTKKGMLQCEATIRMMRTTGAGFRFESMDARTRAQLDVLIAELEDSGG